MPEKCILILLDGLGDRSYDLFGGKTPLQAAFTPALDRLAAGGANGLYHATFPGQALPSETAHFILFGYDMADFPGRGALEAAGAGIALSMDDVAVLAHFASLSETDGTLLLEDGKPATEPKEAAALSETVSSFCSLDTTVTFHRTGGIHGIVKLTGDVSPFITDTDPVTDGRPLSEVLPLADFREDPAAVRTAQVLHAYLAMAYERLGTLSFNRARKKKKLLPVNGMVTQRAGRFKKVEPFPLKYGLSGLSISSGLVYQGLAACIGMDTLKVEDTGDPGADMAERLLAAKARLDTYDFVHVHTKMPDDAAHTKDPCYKKSVIESLDKGIGSVLEQIASDPDILVIVTADHSTPSQGPLVHSGESVPLIFHGSGVRQDRVSRFDEVSAAGGLLGHLRAKELMYLLLNHLERSKLAGLMDTPADRPYFPGNACPFKLKP